MIDRDLPFGHLELLWTACGFSWLLSFGSVVINSSLKLLRKRSNAQLWFVDTTAADNDVRCKRGVRYIGAKWVPSCEEAQRGCASPLYLQSFARSSTVNKQRTSNTSLPLNSSNNGIPLVNHSSHICYSNDKNYRGTVPRKLTEPSLQTRTQINCVVVKYQALLGWLWAKGTMH